MSKTGRRRSTPTKPQPDITALTGMARSYVQVLQQQQQQLQQQIGELMRRQQELAKHIEECEQVLNGTETDTADP